MTPSLFRVDKGPDPSQFPNKRVSLLSGVVEPNLAGFESRSFGILISLDLTT